MEPILLKLLKGGQEGVLIEQGWTKKTTLGSRACLKLLKTTGTWGTRYMS